ncbi:hypothetical protein BDW62DRAFT_88723 [Aspergillus aurantiobrunneus]
MHEGWRFFTGRIYISDISITRAFSGGLVKACISLRYLRHSRMESRFWILYISVGWLYHCKQDISSPTKTRRQSRHLTVCSAWLHS